MTKDWKTVASVLFHILPPSAVFLANAVACGVWLLEEAAHASLCLAYMQIAN